MPDGKAVHPIRDVPLAVNNLVLGSTDISFKFTLYNIIIDPIDLGIKFDIDDSKIYLDFLIIASVIMVLCFGFSDELVDRFFPEKRLPYRAIKPICISLI
jgi:hypothetical protein